MAQVPPVLDIDLQATLHSPGRNFTLAARFTSQSTCTALMGPSGAGKSTVLLAIAGLLAHVQGHVRVQGQTLQDSAAGIHRPARSRSVGMVFQDYALFPHLSVEQNLLFGVQRLGQRLAPEARARVEALLLQFDLLPLRTALPRSLSGGQRQRVALNRALAPAPQLLLLDEPLSALDGSLRQRLRAELAEMLKRVPVPTLLVTHEPQDAALLAQAVVRLEHGKVLD